MSILSKYKYEYDSFSKHIRKNNKMTMEIKRCKYRKRRNVILSYTNDGCLHFFYNAYINNMRINNIHNRMVKTFHYFARRISIYD